MRPIYLFSTSSHPDAKSVNSLEITFLKPSIDFSLYDYLIITSKQAIHALKQYSTLDYQAKKSLCISNATATSSSNAGIKVLEVGAGYGDTLINIIQTYPKTTRWLYLRAQIVASDFAQICKDNGYSIDESIVYKSECSKTIATTIPPANAILIFTSPSSVQCFLEHHHFTQEHFTIVIGRSTAKKIPKETLYAISSKPSIASCMELAKTKSSIFLV